MADQVAKPNTENIPIKFKPLAKAARLILFRKDMNMTFFGALAYKFFWHFMELPENQGGHIRLNLENGQSSDGGIYIANWYVSQPKFSPHNLAALIIHELLHLLNKHSVRRGQRESKLWNIACDHCCDRDLKEMKVASHYNNSFNIIDDLHNQHPNCTTEQAYMWLQQQQQQQRFSISVASNNVLQVTDNKTGKKWNVNGDQELTPEEKRAIQSKVEQFIAESRALYETLKQKGQIEGGVKEYLDKILKVKIPWQRLLEMAIKTNVIMKPDDRSWRKLNNYYRHLGLTLPGPSMVEDNEGVGHLILTVDTSGSISSKTLQEFAGIIHQSMKYFQRITVITHDVPIHQIKEFDKDNIAAFEEWLKNEGLQGRGGTSHEDAFTWIEKNIWEDIDERNDLSMVISLTDGYSDLQDQVAHHKWVNSETPLVLLIDGDWKHEFTDRPNIKIIHIKSENEE